MPLLCISLLALLLLPLSLSCDSIRPPSRDNWLIVQTHLSNANKTITALLKNSSCPALKHKLPICTPDVDVVSTLYTITCKMENLSLSLTNQLVSTVLNSLQCHCLTKTTKEPSVTRRRRNEQKTSRRETKRICRAEAFLSAMTKCYQMLNARSPNT